MAKFNPSLKKELDNIANFFNGARTEISNKVILYNKLFLMKLKDMKKFKLSPNQKSLNTFLKSIELTDNEKTELGIENLATFKALSLTRFR